MQIHRWQSGWSPSQAVALTIGNFDGVHLGHQAMLYQLQQAALARDLDSMLMSFFPHPKMVLQQARFTTITTLPDRAFWLDYYRLQHWLLLAFTPSLRKVSAREFVLDYLLKRLNVRYFLVGDDFRFGYKGLGDIELLQKMAQAFGFEVQAHESVRYADNGQRVSSSIIRQALFDHDLALAQAYLGHALTFTGRVRHGDKRGRALGAPTLNLHVPENWCLPDGVYVVKVNILAQNESVWGVANVGKTLTFAGKHRKLEVFLFGGRYHLYEQRLQVEIKHFIRKMRQFDTQEALQAQIQQDIIDARAVIARLSAN